MQGNRVSKVDKLINQELSRIIQRLNFPKQVLVTLTRVRCSSNLIKAKVFISVMPEDKEEEVFEILNNNIYDIQQKLNNRLEMRPVPKINFVKEEKVREAAEIERILKEIKEEEDKS